MGMKRHRGTGWLALAGLILIVVLLLSATLGALLVLWQTNAQTDRAIHILDLYQQAYYLARAGDSEADEYFLNPGTTSQKAFFANANDMDRSLSALAQLGGERNLLFLTQLRHKQARYISLVKTYFSLVDAHSPQARSFYNTLADPQFVELNELLKTKVRAEGAVVSEALTRLKTTQQTIALAFVLFFVFGLSLLLFFGKAFQKSRHVLARVRQEAWERMEQMARTDPLTGLPNHRVTIEHLEAHLSSSQHLQQACSLLFIDLDHFKHINDQWGHQAGDTVLCEVGHRLRGMLRQDDVVGRYGGEEFVVVLPQTDLRQANRLAELVRIELADRPCPLTDGHQDEETREPLLITASIGVASFALHGKTSAALLEAADSAMYQAKDSGRNRVCVASC
ncbi:MAG TPA: GGDEF domain-containing protein, partial [Ktedonobacteraceae bacterium]|nr:GGDEF domain-containing protein [Ktedonobacteraceae bacterium]